MSLILMLFKSAYFLEENVWTLFFFLFFSYSFFFFFRYLKKFSIVLLIRSLLQGAKPLPEAWAFACVSPDDNKLN